MATACARPWMPPLPATTGACVGTYAYGTQVSLAATPASGQSFFGYAGDCTGGSCQLTMTQAHTVSAGFITNFLSDDFESEKASLSERTRALMDRHPLYSNLTPAAA